MKLLPTKELGRRCSIGCQTWPNDPEYAECPVCGEPTRIYRGVHPISQEEAQKALRRAEFEDFYENEWTPDETPITDEELEDMLGVSIHTDPSMPKDSLLLVEPSSGIRMPLRGSRKTGGTAAFGP